jgi:hypothetical protein
MSARATRPADRLRRQIPDQPWLAGRAWPVRLNRRGHRAIFNETGTVTQNDSTVSGNTATFGGGIFNFNPPGACHVAVARCVDWITVTDCRSWLLVPGQPPEAGWEQLRAQVAELRAANARLREVIEAKGAQLSAPRRPWRRRRRGLPR